MSSTKGGKLMTSSNDEKLKEAQQLVEDLVYLVRKDNDIAEYIIDEYVYLCDDKRVKELQKLVDDEYIEVEV